MAVAGGDFDGAECSAAFGVEAVDGGFVPIFAVGFYPVDWDRADEAAAVRNA